MDRKHAQSGFTLLEVLLVVAAIAILSGIVIVAINPSQQLAESRNDQRQVDVRTILSALEQYMSEHNNNTPDVIINYLATEDCPNQPDTDEICATGAEDCTGLLDFSALTANQKYLAQLPIDPHGGFRNANATGYGIIRLDASHRLVVCALKSELGEPISITQ